MDLIEAAIEAIESCESGEDFTYKGYAMEFGVDQSTLSRRHRRVTQSRATTNNNQGSLFRQRTCLSTYLPRWRQCRVKS